MEPMSPAEWTLQRSAEAIGWYLARPRPASTCSLSGTGAIAELEGVVAEIHGVGHAISVSSGTGALLGSLLAIGVDPNWQVMMATTGWRAVVAVANVLGCTPMFLSDWRGTTISMAAGFADGPSAAIVEAGTGNDQFGIVSELTSRDVVVVEDLANAWGTWPIGPIAATSLGPGKAVDAGEGGVILTDDADLAAEVERVTQHPIRQLLRGVGRSGPALCMRIHPVAAVTALHQIHLGAGSVSAARSG